MIVRMWRGRVRTARADHFYPEDKDFFLEFEPTVVHHKVIEQES